MTEQELEEREQELERESRLEDYIDQYGEVIKNDVTENYKAYGLNQKDVQQSTDKFNQEVCQEIVRSFDNQDEGDLV